MSRKSIDSCPINMQSSIFVHWDGKRIYLEDDGYFFHTVVPKISAEYPRKSELFDKSLELSPEKAKEMEDFLGCDIRPPEHKDKSTIDRDTAMKLSQFLDTYTPWTKDAVYSLGDIDIEWMNTDDKVITDSVFRLCLALHPGLYAMSERSIIDDGFYVDTNIPSPSREIFSGGSRKEICKMVVGCYSKRLAERISNIISSTMRIESLTVLQYFKGIPEQVIMKVADNNYISDFIYNSEHKGLPMRDGSLFFPSWWENLSVMAKLRWLSNSDIFVDSLFMSLDLEEHGGEVASHYEEIDFKNPQQAHDTMIDIVNVIGIPLRQNYWGATYEDDSAREDVFSPDYEEPVHQHGDDIFNGDGLDQNIYDSGNASNTEMYRDVEISVDSNMSCEVGLIKYGKKIIATIVPVTKRSQLIRAAQHMNVCVGSSSYGSLLENNKSVFFVAEYNDRTIFVSQYSLQGQKVEMRGYRNSVFDNEEDIDRLIASTFFPDRQEEDVVSRIEFDIPAHGYVEENQYAEV